ncbi:hypothetical protein BD410DRAFT_903200 [Rickenella mellea]|uniref:Ricin B lectin domain-containing protein n=1 Tax=Rickenella mellea TaxID=50990 RepID=A0A4Y7PEN9_9AGAM|nr:hypothetical protein BD410DRAFT_903200 [Rickenella mellea]
MPSRKPAIIGEPIPSGTYLIQNVHWDTFLELPDRNASKVVSVQLSAEDKGGKSQRWKVVHIGGGQYSIEDNSKYATWGFGAQSDSGIVDRSNMQQVESEAGTYTIQPTDVELYWGLSDGKAGTEVKVYSNAYSRSNQWYFIPLDDK